MVFHVVHIDFVGAVRIDERSMVQVSAQLGCLSVLESTGALHYCKSSKLHGDVLYRTPICQLIFGCCMLMWLVCVCVSGLDSTTAMHVLEILRQLAQGGRAIITTIHQPSSRLFQTLDKLLLLSQVLSIALFARFANERCTVQPRTR